MPHRSSVAQPWRMQAGRYRLAGSECRDCGSVAFPARAECTCGSVNAMERVMGGEGEIVTYTVIHTAPEGFEDNVPYVVGIVKLKEGPVITAQIVGPHDEIKIGRKVKSVFRKLSEHGKGGLLHYGFKFEVMDSEKSLLSF